MKMNSRLRRHALAAVRARTDVLEEARDAWIELLQEQEYPDGETIVPGDELDDLVFKVLALDPRLAASSLVLVWQDAPWREVEAECRRLHPRWFFTADRVPVVDGLRVWDYDREPGAYNFEKSFRHTTPDYWDGWFQVRRDRGGHSLMNGERTATWTPHDGTVPPKVTP